jgi:hypothetical protein
MLVGGSMSSSASAWMRCPLQRIVTLCTAVTPDSTASGKPALTDGFTSLAVLLGAGGVARVGDGVSGPWC